jgi:molecular chaperone HtpG
MVIEIPPRLLKLLYKEPAFSSDVMKSVTDFDNWLANFTKGLPFFPNYTDHGPAHISAILRSADLLITPEAYGVLSPQDAGVLILASLLHDSAMHLTEDGANAFIRRKSSEKLLKPIDKLSWAALWAGHVREGRVWDDDHFESVFGQKTRLRPDGTSLARDMPDDTRLWDTFDRLFVGDFLRKHHPRLAHEIGVFGVPAPHGVTSRLELSIDRETAELAGFVARSHGMPLREAVDRLPGQNDFVEEVRGVKAVYLMALLRIADFLELEPNQA